MNAIIAALASGSFLAAVLGVIFHRRMKSLEASLNQKLQQNFEVFRTTHAWKVAAITELLGPMVMQLDRTRRAFSRYSEKNPILEAKVLADANGAVRTLLLTKGHLIPPNLLDDAGRLVEHLEVWLEEFEAARSAGRIYVGPKGFPFPKSSEANLIEAFHRLREEVYGITKDDVSPRLDITAPGASAD